MTDWRPGNLCICVDFSPNTAGDKPPLTDGTIYPVDDVAYPGDISRGRQAEHLSLKVRGTWYFATRFRKVHPDKPKACTRSFHNRLKRRVSA